MLLFEKVAIGAISAVTTISLTHLGVTAAEFHFVEDDSAFPSWYNTSGHFIVDDATGIIRSGSYTSDMTQTIDLTGIVFNGQALVGTSSSGTQFREIPFKDPALADIFQLLDLSSSDQVPEGVTDFSTPGLVFTEVVTTN